MKAHIIIVRSREKMLTGAYYICGRAAALLRGQADEGSEQDRWTSTGPHRDLSDTLRIFELITPNSVEPLAVLEAVNNAVRMECPWLRSLDWERLLFCSVSCENQDQ
jgi:hypothetical protein